MGGLLVLEEMSLLRTVLQKAASVLLVRNLNNCIKEKRDEKMTDCHTYLDEEMSVEVGAPRVYFVGVLNSASLDKINSLKSHQSQY